MPQCPGSHCSSVSQEINEICKSDGFSGSTVYVLGPDGKQCYCKCSCLAYDSLVAVPGGEWKKIQEFKVGDSVLVARPDKTWRTTKVAFSNGTQGDGTQVPYTIHIKLATEASLIVTADHPFMTAKGILKRADHLSPLDQLLDEHFHPVKIVSLNFGVYTGGIHNISTSKGGPGESIWNHLINTSGVISGDYYAQLFLTEAGILASSTLAKNEEQRTLQFDTVVGPSDEPQMGSPEYEALYGDVNATRQGTNELLQDSNKTTESFQPYGKFIPPPGAVSFLPDNMETAAPGMLHALDEPMPIEIAQDMTALFERWYGGVRYDIAWGDNRVNAYAWRDADGTRHVQLLGGLIRHRSLLEDGLSLVIAHELGHHYGGNPVYPGSDLACEGQADHWGARVAMRQVWRSRYVAVMFDAIDQLYNLFTTGLVATTPVTPSLGGCSHPPADCRRDTYLAAMRLSGKPGCAG